MANVTGKGLPRSLKGVTLSVSWTEITGKPTTFAPVPATTSVVGGVKKTPAIPDVASQTVSGADATAVATSATTAVNAVGTKLNALLAALRTAGIATT